MRDEMIEQFRDGLQNIEIAIISVYQGEPDLLDLDVIDALDALVRRYVADEEGRTPPKLRLPARPGRVFEAVEGMCEWRLGRAAMNDGDGEVMIPPDGQYSVADVLKCLKRIRKSVRTWNEQGGRQGYLDYVTSFLARM